MHDVTVTRTLDDDHRRAVEALCAATDAADRHPSLSDDHLIALRHPRTPDFAAFLARDERRLVGYAQLIDEPGGRSLEVVVHPLHRDSSVAEDLTRAALALVADEGGATMQQLVVRATDADDVRAASLGFAPTRDLLQLRCELPLEMEPEWPAGIEVRTFEPGRDDDAWLAVNNRAFAGHPEQSEWDHARLVDRTAAPWFDPAGFLLAVHGRDIAGFCWTKIHDMEHLGEIYVIGVDPAHQGGGLGRALAIAGLASLAERGVPTGMLYVDAANRGAVAMYRSLGFVEHHRDRWYTATVEGTR